VPRGQIFLNLIDLLRNDHCTDGVLLTIHNALLQRRHRLAPLHLLRVGTQCVHHIDIHRTGHAHVQSAHVIRGADRACVVGHFAKAVLAPSQNDNALFQQNIRQDLPGCALRGRIDLLVIGIEIGQREHRHLGYQWGHVDGRCHHQIQCATTDHFSLTHLIAARQLRIGEDAHCHIAIRTFGQQCGKPLGSLVPRRCVTCVMRQSQFLRAGRTEIECDRKACRQCRACEVENSHSSLPWNIPGSPTPSSRRRRADQIVDP